MIKNIRNEFFKIYRSNKFLVFSLIIIGISIALGVLIRMIEVQGLLPQEQMIEITGGFFSIQVLTTISDVILPILVTLLVSFLVIDETNTGTLKLPFLCGYHRTEVLIGKMVAVLITMFAIMIISWISATITAIFLWGAGTVISSLFEALIFYMETYLAIVSWAIIMFFVALFIHNSGTMIGIIAVFLLISSLFAGFFPGILKFFVPYYFKGFISTTSSVDFWLGVGVCLLTAIFFGGLAFIKFNKMEINK